MRMKLLAAACATGFLATTAVAQKTDPKTGAGPDAPTAAQCKAGYKAGSKMTKKQFDTACAKTRERKEKTQ
jgi:hypothetical protein